MRLKILEFIIENWISLITILMALIPIVRLHSINKTLRIQLSLIIDNSHSVAQSVKQNSDNEALIEAVQNLNHQITHLLVLQPKLAKQWIKINKPPEEWPIWEQKLQISMKKYKK